VVSGVLVVLSLVLAGFGAGVVVGGYAVLSRLRMCRRGLEACQRATGEMARLLRLYRACCGVVMGGDRAAERG